MKKYELIYIGYFTGMNFYHPVLLAVSNSKTNVQLYCKLVRGLRKDQYEIREVTLDWETTCSLYEDYILQEYSEDYPYLTSRDIYYINQEVESTIQQLESTYRGLCEYRNIISRVNKLKSDLNQFDLTLRLMEKHLSKVKNLRRIGISITDRSIAFTQDIMEYLNHMGYLQEDRELTREFYRKIREED